MPLTSQALSGLVFIDHLSLFPTSAGVLRSNPVTGVPPHIPAQAFITALCTAVATVLPTLPLFDIGGGTLDVPGVPVPVPVQFPGAPAAIAYLLSRQGWTGPQSAQAAQIFVGSVLLNVSKLALLQMNPNLLLGTGTGIVSPASNPGLEAAALAGLLGALPGAFQVSGKFGTGDVPGTPTNPQLLAQLPGYAEALAKGIASLTAQVPYVGNASNPAPIVGAINTGRLL